MKNNYICIVTPIWKDKMTDNELFNIRHSLSLNVEIQHFFVCPQNLDKSFYLDNFTCPNFIEFNEFYFKSIERYNVLMQSAFFYETFSKYKYILILQTDAVLIKTLNLDIISDFDYIGAPWIKGLLLPRYISSNRFCFFLLKAIGMRIRCYVGNGGLSIRKTDAFYHICLSSRPIRWLNEDMFFSQLGATKKLKVPSIGEAKEIFLEKSDSMIHEFPDVYGLHAPEKYYPILYSKFRSGFN